MDKAIWVNKIGGDADSEFKIRVVPEICDVNDIRKAINESVECAKAPEQFGYGAVCIYSNASATSEYKLSARDGLFCNGDLKWVSLFFSEPEQSAKQETVPGIQFRFRRVAEDPALQEYVFTGNQLKVSGIENGVANIENGITQFVDSVPGSVSDAVHFAYLDGSSGLGKTQLAFALHRPVLYIPLGESQAIYKCFGDIYDVISLAVRKDMEALTGSSSTPLNDRNFQKPVPGQFSMRHIKEAPDAERKYFTVPVLLKFLELFTNSRAEGLNVLADAGVNRETNVFLGADCDVRIEGMTVMAGQLAAEKYRDVLIYLDEIPAIDEPSFKMCLFLRNMIRCLVLPCLLSGTESTLLDMMTSVRGSRNAGRTEYAWLLTKFPATQFDPLNVQMDRFGEYEQHLLRCSRPLFVQYLNECIDKQPVSTTVATASQGSRPLLRMTPEALTEMKYKICVAKTAGFGKDEPWLHASTLLVFADSLAGSGEVTATVAAEGALQVGEKRAASSSTLSHPQNKKQKMSDVRDNVMKHTLVIRKHFALLYIASERIDTATGMTRLYLQGDKLYLRDEQSSFKVRAAFPTCAEDPLLYMACLRGGLMWHSESENIVQVPSSHAFNTFRVSSKVGNSQAPSNDGVDLEAECMAAAVLAAHRYTSFTGTPFLRWLELLIAELSQHEKFNETPIDKVPAELEDALQAIQVPLLSPPNCPWGEKSMRSDINFGNLAWCQNRDMRDGFVPLAPPEVARYAQEKKEESKENEKEELEEERGAQGEVEFVTDHGFQSLALEIKDTKENFGGDKVVAVTQRVPEGSVTVLVCSHLAEWKETTVAKFAADISVYRMKNKGAIERVSTDKWIAGRKLLIALDLSTLQPGRYEALPHST